MNKKVVAIIVISFLIGLCVGMSLGSYMTTMWFIDRAIMFLEANNIELDALDKDLLIKGIIAYEDGNHALVYTDTGNKT